jgi:acyl-CoA thioesterase
MRSEGISVLDEPVRGSAADPAVLALPGIEQVRALLDGRLAEPPNARLTGRRLLEVRHGSVAFGMPASAWLLGPKAKLHPVGPSLDPSGAATDFRPNGPESLRLTADGLMSRPPIDRLLGIRLVDTAEGEATFTMPSSPWLTNEFGAVSGGMLALLAKSATAAAGQAAARSGSSFRALDVKVNFIRGVPPDGKDIIARGHVSHRGQLTVASAVIEHDGLTVALATGSTMLGS